jgi:hypothetical protein
LENALNLGSTMTKKRRARLHVPVPLSAAEAQGEIDTSRVVAHSDGFYWLSDDGRHETGPFANFEDALSDLARAEQADSEVGESIDEARDELGLSNWVDPDTHELAEEQATRIEDH